MLDADITSYFANVDHGLMMSRVEELIPDEKINNLIRQWIAARIYDGHQISSMQKGLPQGSPISPLLANLYLDTFDDQMLSSGQKLVRFADDFVVLCKTKPHAERALRLSRQLLSNLRLTLSEEKTSITNFADGFKYLGVTFTGGMTLTAARDRALEQSPVSLPPPLPVLRAAPFRSKVFNPAIRNALLEAFEDVAAEQIPSFFQRPRELSEQTSNTSHQLSATEEPGSRELVEESASRAEPAGSSDTIAELITRNRTGVVGDESSDGDDTSHQSGRGKARMSKKPRFIPPPSTVALRTLYIHEHGAVIRCEDEHLRILKDDIEVLSLPAFKIDQIILFGNSQVTTGAMKFCLRHDIPIFVLNGMGRFFGAIESTGNQRVLLQQKQFERLADEEFVLNTARQIVSGKIWNCRTVLQRRLRSKPRTTGILEAQTAANSLDVSDYSIPPEISAIAQSSENSQRVETSKVQNQSSTLASLVVKPEPEMSNRLAQSINNLLILSSALSKANTLDEIRGHEGAAAASYYAGLSVCLPQSFKFTKRTRQPPLDPINAMLSFGYTLLFYNVYAIVRGRGLSPYVGSLHALRQGHPALCSDLIEEFRAPLIDSLVMSLVNKRIFSPADFYYLEWDDAMSDTPAAPSRSASTRPFSEAATESQPELAQVPNADVPVRPITHSEDDQAAIITGCYLSDAGRRTFVEQFELRINTLVNHPAAGIRTTWRGCIDLQVMTYIKALRGEIVTYIPFLVR